MESFARRYNKERTFDIDTTGFEYKKLSDLYAENPDRIYTVRAVYINTSNKFGDSPLVATDECFVNFPSYMIDAARNILSSGDDIKAINDGLVGFKVHRFIQKQYHRECYGVVWVDIAPEPEDYPTFEEIMRSRRR